MTKEERNNSIKVIRNFDLNNPKVNSLLFSTDEITNAFDRAIEALEHESEWIPVSEQLPKLTIKTYDNDFHEITISEKVLVTVNCKGNIYIETATYSDRGWLNNDYVVAWKLLPEPYKSEIQEEYESD